MFSFQRGYILMKVFISIQIISDVYIYDRYSCDYSNRYTDTLVTFRIRVIVDAIFMIVAIVINWGCIVNGRNFSVTADYHGRII